MAVITPAVGEDPPIAEANTTGFGVLKFESKQGLNACDGTGPGSSIRHQREIA